MSLVEFLSRVASLSSMLFVVTSMLALEMSMSLTISQIIRHLKNLRLVLPALLANIVLVPLLAYLITLVIPLNEPLKARLIVLMMIPLGFGLLIKSGSPDVAVHWQPVMNKIFNLAVVHGDPAGGLW